MSGRPLGVYIHWPYCARICPYCDFNVVRARGRTGEERALADAIAAALERQARLIGPRTLVSVFFGGGTPSLMAPEAVERLIGLARRLWPGDGPVEVSLEANPTDAEADRFNALRAAGVERLSLGVQAFDDAALGFLGRAHDAAETARAVATAAGVFPRLSLDLIYAFPGQGVDVWRAALRRAAATGAEHLSPYQLTIEPGTAFERAVKRGRWAPPDEALAAALYEATQTELERLGYEAYEVSNHARSPAARARHNLVYWRGEDYFGVGPGAHGRLTLADGTRLATEATAGVRDYIAEVAAGRAGHTATALSPIEQAEERAMLGLRTVEGVAVTELTPLPLRRLDELVEQGLLARTGDRLTATRRGRIVLNAVVSALAVD